MVSYCGCGVCGDFKGMIAGIWVLHSSGKSGGELVTLFASYFNGVSAGIWCECWYMV